MKTLEEYLDNFKKDCSDLDLDYEDMIPLIEGYTQGFIDATKLAAENAETHYVDYGIQTIREVDKQSILKAIE